MVLSMVRKVIGCAASASFSDGTATTIHKHDNQNSIQAVRFSRLGLSQAETKVGIDPKNTTLRLVTIPRMGSLKIHQRAMPRTAPPKQNRSNRVQPGVPNRNAIRAITHAPSTAATIWPFTLCSAYIPAITIESTPAQMSHDALAGFASFRRIALAYGTNPAACSNAATKENISRTDTTSSFPLC